jgi:DnaK suppressor protein
MAATLPAFPTKSSGLSALALDRLRGLLVDQLHENAEQASLHEATARQLRGETDADSAIERELAVACAARARETLEDVHQALDRLDHGTYGLCLSCRRAIPFERLEAIPHARLCVACPRPR